MRGKNAFTLAEVLITLAIIGVVAAMTIPTLVAEYNQKSWDTAATVFNRRLGEALAMMNTTSSLAGYSTTADFVEELGKHIKITKTCTSDKLTDCFTSTITTTGDPVETKDLKASKNLYSTENYGTETIGVQFADGVSALIAYNPKATQDPLSNQVVRLTGSKDSVGLSTDAISILYDVSGFAKPNEYSNTKDLRGINILINTSEKIQLILGAFTASEAKTECENISKTIPELGSYDYTNKSCNTDAAENTLCFIYNNKETFNITSGIIFSNTEGERSKDKWGIDFSTGTITNLAPSETANALCIDN